MWTWYYYIGGDGDLINVVSAMISGTVIEGNIITGTVSTQDIIVGTVQSPVIISGTIKQQD